MTKLFLFSTLILSLNAQAITCETDDECLNETISLVKQALKIKACKTESTAAIEAAQSIATPSTSIKALEDCINGARQIKRRQERAAKRAERLNKAKGNS